MSIVSTSAQAACDNIAPASGATVNCVGVIPNVTAPGVVAATGSTGVTIGVQVPGGGEVLRFTGLGLQVQSQSSVTNDGDIVVTGGPGSGLKGAISGLSNNNTIINNGSIVTSGTSTRGIQIGTSAAGGGGVGNTITNNGAITTQTGSSNAIHVVGGNNTITNNGAIETSGGDSSGVYAQGDGNALVNGGSILTHGAEAEAVFMNTVASSFRSSVTNLAGGSIVSDQSYAFRGLNGSDTVVNAGLLEGHGGASGDTAVQFGNSGNNTFILQTGSQIVGASNGGGGNSNVFLEGSGTVDSTFRNFNTLTMRGTAWNWQTDATFNNTVIQSGSLALSAILISPVHIESAGTLTTDGGAGGTLFVTSNPYPGVMVPRTVSGVVSGTGTVNGNLWNDGTIHPGVGDGTGALTITGNYENKSNGVLQVDVMPASAGRLVVNGSVTIDPGSTIVANFRPGDYSNWQQQQVIQCTGDCVTGSFTAYNPSAFIDSTVFSTNTGTGLNSVYIGYQRNATTLAEVASENDKAVAASLDENARLGGMTATVNQIVTMSAAQAQGAFSSLNGGGVHATLAGLSLRQNNLFGRAVSQRLATWHDDEMEHGRGFWVRPYGMTGHLDGNGGDTAIGADYDTTGLAMGMDMRVTPDWLAGGGIDISRMHANFRANNASATTDSVKLGVYGSYSKDDVYFDVLGSIGRHSNDTQRDIGFAGSIFRADADYDGYQAGLYAETGYRILLSPTLTLRPLVSLSYTWQREQAFDESGAGEIGLHGERTTYESVQSGVGARIDKELSVGDGKLMIEGRIKWLHEFNDGASSLQAAFAGDVTGQSFTQYGVEQWRDAAQVGVGVTFAKTNNSYWFLNYDALLAGNETGQAITAGLHYIW
ncbi:autotransporter [Oxalicibacterium solurbis]|uniref:Autotransporter n=2 Tax=Oxalicibacterium solurbis TaxID=69280 RepID=A0A8J3B068_9BURK|nr:autotransporter [Oxalicibacterium solurbis]